MDEQRHTARASHRGLFLLFVLTNGPKQGERGCRVCHKKTGLARGNNDKRGKRGELAGIGQRAYGVGAGRCAALSFLHHLHAGDASPYLFQTQQAAEMGHQRSSHPPPSLYTTDGNAGICYDPDYLTRFRERGLLDTGKQDRTKKPIEQSTTSAQ